MAHLRRNHIVPQFWLSAFADKGKLLARTRAGNEHVVGVNSATVVAHFYRDDDAAAKDPQAVERYLSANVEGPAHQLVWDLVNGQLPSAQSDLDALKKLIAFQIVRTRTFRDIDHQIKDHLWPVFFAMEVVKKVNESRTVPLDGAELHGVFEHARSSAPAKPVAVDESRTQLRILLRMADKLEGDLKRRNFALASGLRRVLLVGDSPAVVWHPGGAPMGWTGLLPDDADLLLPMAPNLLLIATNQGQTGPVALTPELAKIANDGQAAWCSFAVYRHPATRWPRDLHLGADSPKLPIPRVTMSPGTGNSSFPAKFAPVADPSLDQLIKSLGGTDIVE
jgi:hypothetical protein